MQITRRNMLAQVGLMIITLGLYSLYWFYQTSIEVKSLSKDTETNTTLMFVLLFIPFGMLYSHYKYAEMFEKASSDRLNKWILFLLWYLCAPAVWIIVQTELNRFATQMEPTIVTS